MVTLAEWNKEQIRLARRYASLFRIAEDVALARVREWFPVKHARERRYA